MCCVVLSYNELMWCLTIIQNMWASVFLSVIKPAIISKDAKTWEHVDECEMKQGTTAWDWWVVCLMMDFDCAIASESNVGN